MTNLCFESPSNLLKSFCSLISTLNHATRLLSKLRTWCLVLWTPCIMMITLCSKINAHEFPIWGVVMSSTTWWRSCASLSAGRAGINSTGMCTLFRLFRLCTFANAVDSDVNQYDPLTQMFPAQVTKMLWNNFALTFIQSDVKLLFAWNAMAMQVFREKQFNWNIWKLLVCGSQLLLQSNLNYSMIMHIARYK